MGSMTFEAWFLSQYPGISIRSAQAVIQLTEEGSTVPFIARYRKEQTGGLDEVQIQSAIDGKERWEAILKRQSFILQEIESQGKLTDELKKKIQESYQLDVLEDLYLPYKQKKKTKAVKAREAGLEPLAVWVWETGHGRVNIESGQSLESVAAGYISATAGIADTAAAIQGAQDILVERLSETASLREQVRSTVFEQGFMTTEKGEKAEVNSKYETYFKYREKISSLRSPQNSHRYMAIRRGWTEEELKLSLVGPESDPDFEQGLLAAFEREACSYPDTPGAGVLKKAARLAFKAHVLPSIENEVHQVLKTVGDEAAIRIFSENVRKLLLAPPFGPKAVLGVDPGVRTGCKLAIVDDGGRYLASIVLPLQSEGEKQMAKNGLSQLVSNGKLQAIAVGNGTAGRETEKFFREALKELDIDIPVVMVSEAGASVYSASEVARHEFPDLDVTIRGAISIARRLQDPLAELVKIDPKSIGVGQYQHDVSPHALKKSLDLVVDMCVNSVGANLNTASVHLLAHVSGIGPALATAIVDYRSKHGLFKSRKDLLNVSRLNQKVFEQAAGFLRIPQSENPLDNTGVHPERYGILEKFAQKMGCQVSDLLGDGVQKIKESSELKEEIGDYTFNDILSELEKPGRDPRNEFVPFHFREDIHTLSDLKPDMICPGIVTNVTQFGAFVDIGVHQDGLVHLSQLRDEFVTDPNQVVSPGDRVQVKVLTVNLEKKQISLTMKLQEKSEQPRERKTKTKPARPKKPTLEEVKAKERERFEANRGVSPVKLREPSEKKVIPVLDQPRSIPAERSSNTQRTSHRDRPAAHRRSDRTPFNNPFAALAEKFGKK